MTYTVVKENGRYLDGKERDEIIFAVEHDMDHTYIDGVRVDIKSVDITNVTNAVVKVKVGDTNDRP